jgi:hypothetical protein
MAVASGCADQSAQDMDHTDLADAHRVLGRGKEGNCSHELAQARDQWIYTKFSLNHPCPTHAECES